MNIYISYHEREREGERQRLIQERERDREKETDLFTPCPTNYVQGIRT